MNQARTPESMQKYAEEKLNFIFEALFLEILQQQPNNVIDWTLSWLDKKGRQLVQQNERPKLKRQVSSNASDDEEVIEIPKRAPAQRKQRASISAEVFGTHNKRENYIPKFVEKADDQKLKISNRLNQAFMFAALEVKEKQIVINAMEIKSYKPNDWIIKQGEEGDFLYVVDSGELDCFKKIGDEQKLVKKYAPGESFGELALLYNAKRQASIQARTECTLFALDRNTFNTIVKDSAMRFFYILFTKSIFRKREEYLQVLKKIDILSEMDQFEKSHVADGIKQYTYKEGDYVIREGEQGDIFYMIESGSLIATKTINPGEEPVKVYEYKNGDYFGELALLKNIPRQANVVATSEVKLIYLDRECFKRLMGPLEDILKRNMEKYEAYQNRLNK
ncbi:hypothetical protein pb186bvf_003353 [Paramecium bursaria]